MCINKYDKHLNIVVCPETKQRLFLHDLATIEKRTGHRMTALRILSSEVKPDTPAPVGPTPYVLAREDQANAYPIVDGIPILLAPEILGPQDHQKEFDLRDPRYAEAYEEMGHYNAVAALEASNIESSQIYKTLQPVLAVSEKQRTSFPYPRDVWLDAVYDSASQWDAYMNIAPIFGKRVLQLGGKGIHAVKFLLAGAEEAWVLSPMLGEMCCAMALARAVGVDSRLHCVVAVAEQLPFQDASFDAVYSGGCVHHMVTSVAIPEIARVLRCGGNFSAIDPWRTPLYSIGTRIFGKREPNIYCRPLNNARIEPLMAVFKKSRIVHHGALLRYPLLALRKLGISVSLSLAWRINIVDDTLSSLIPAFCRHFGGSVALLGVK